MLAAPEAARLTQSWLCMPSMTPEVLRCLHQSSSAHAFFGKLCLQMMYKVAAHILIIPVRLPQWQLCLLFPLSRLYTLASLRTTQSS